MKASSRDVWYMYFYSTVSHCSGDSDGSFVALAPMYLIHSVEWGMKAIYIV